MSYKTMAENYLLEARRRTQESMVNSAVSSLIGLTGPASTFSDGSNQYMDRINELDKKIKEQEDRERLKPYLDRLALVLRFNAFEVHFVNGTLPEMDADRAGYQDWKLERGL